MVQVAWRRDVDEVDVVSLNDAFPIGVVLQPARAFGCFSCGAEGAGTDDLHYRLDADVEKAADLPIGIAMCLAHKAGAQERDVQRFRHSRILQPTYSLSHQDHRLGSPFFSSTIFSPLAVTPKPIRGL